MWDGLNPRGILENCRSIFKIFIIFGTCEGVSGSVSFIVASGIQFGFKRINN